MRAFNQIKTSFFFKKRALFNKVSNSWMLYLSKIGPADFEAFQSNFVHMSAFRDDRDELIAGVK